MLILVLILFARSKAPTANSTTAQATIAIIDGTNSGTKLIVHFLENPDHLVSF
ncbi:hypothetical protein GV51_0405 [Gardnerella vaginalis 5-1]|nr:hypothetical protein GV51_0405 [Gardnerella vaginalis 5-1]